MKRPRTGHSYCGIHGGESHALQPHITLPEACQNQPLYVHRLRVEDIIRHQTHCPVCARALFKLPVWHWDDQLARNVAAQSCGEGERLMLLLCESIAETANSRKTVIRSERESAHIERLVLHTGTCTICRSQRTESAIWDWTDADKSTFCLHACSAGQRYVTAWDQLLFGTLIRKNYSAA